MVAENMSSDTSRLVANDAGSIDKRGTQYLLTLKGEQLADQIAANNMIALSEALTRDIEQHKTAGNTPEVIIHVQDTRILSGQPLGVFMEMGDKLRKLGIAKPPVVVDMPELHNVFETNHVLKFSFNLTSDIEAAKLQCTTESAPILNSPLGDVKRTKGGAYVVSLYKVTGNDLTTRQQGDDLKDLVRNLLERIESDRGQSGFVDRNPLQVIVDVPKNVALLNDEPLNKIIDLNQAVRSRQGRMNMIIPNVHIREKFGIHQLSDLLGVVASHDEIDLSKAARGK